MSIYSYRKNGNVLDLKGLDIEQLHDLAKGLEARVREGIPITVKWEKFEVECILCGKEAEELVRLPEIYRMVGEKFAQIRGLK